MKTRKEAIIQLALAISGWSTKRGRAYLRQDEQEFKRADKIIDYWVERLEDYMKTEPIVVSEQDVWTE